MILQQFFKYFSEYIITNKNKLKIFASYQLLAYLVMHEYLADQTYIKVGSYLKEMYTNTTNFLPSRVYLRRPARDGTKKRAVVFDFLI